MNLNDFKKFENERVELAKTLVDKFDGPGKDFRDESESESDNDSLNSNESDFDDVELLKTMSREDLFTLVNTDPKYFLGLIKDNKLCQQLSILISRSEDGGGLNIKFRIYPEDRWIEVGYFSESNDDEVIQDFSEQVHRLLGRNRGSSGSSDDSETVSKAKRVHLTCQLEGNNDVLSAKYGNDLKTDKIDKIDKKCDKPVIKKHNPSIKMVNVRADGDDENLKDSLMVEVKTAPVDILNNFVAIILDKIMRNLPKIVDISLNHDYHHLSHELNTMVRDVPVAYRELHNELFERIKGYEYLQKIHKLSLNKYPELLDDLIRFHRSSMKINQTLYLQIKKEALTELMSDEEKEILKQYSLDVQKLWIDYVKSHDCC